MIDSKKNLLHEFKKEIDEYKSFLDLLKVKLNNEKINKGDLK